MHTLTESDLVDDMAEQMRQRPNGPWIQHGLTREQYDRVCRIAGERVGSVFYRPSQQRTEVADEE